MLVMRTTEDPTDSVGEFISTQQPIGLDHLALAVYPFGLYDVQPRTLFRQKAAYDPHSAAALLNLTVMFSEPSSQMAAYVPGSVVPDENQHFLLASRFKVFAAPREELCRYAAHRSAIHEPQPRLLVEFGQIEPVARDGLRLGIVFGDRVLDEAKGLSFFRPAAQSGQSQPAPPALITEAHRPIRIGLSYSRVKQVHPVFPLGKSTMSLRTLIAPLPCA